MKHDWQKKENKYSNLPQNSMALGVVVLCNSFILYQFPHNSPKNFNQIYIIKVFLNDSSECYGKRCSCLVKNYCHTQACDNYYTKCI